MPKKKNSSKKEYSLERPPVVAMLGHVDHGKTSLLDKIRGTKVQACEAGGITQNIRAHKVEYKRNKGESYFVTFVDTPGHEAFSQMRSRGANVTDIVVLVVAANDGVQPQTKEAISFAKEAGVPMIVALNKVDIQGVDKDKVKRELVDAGVQIEELGGEVMLVETSAIEETGIDELLESIMLLAQVVEIEDKKAGKGKAEVVVLESTKDKSLGMISLGIVRRGEFKLGDFYGWDSYSGKIKAIKSDDFCDQKEAKVSDPVWLVGLTHDVEIGDIIFVFSDLSEFKIEEKAEKKKKKKEEEEESEEEELDGQILSQLLENREEKTELNVILKSESQGTLEVVEQEISEISTEDVKLNILQSGTGDINEDDILKAKDAGGIVVGFKSKLSKKNEKIARIEKVIVRNYEIIYELLEEIEEVLESMREPEEVEVEVARAEIKKVFELSDGTKVAGCKVIKGNILKGYHCFVERKEGQKAERIGEGKITSLKYKKEEVKEAGKDTECGILLEPQVVIQKGDEIVCFKIEKQ